MSPYVGKREELDLIARFDKAVKHALYVKEGDGSMEPNPQLFCMVCGDNCWVPVGRDHMSFNLEAATISANWGYPSIFDGELHRCLVCDKCYKKIALFICGLGGKILVHDYLMRTDEGLVDMREQWNDSKE